MKINNRLRKIRAIVRPKNNNLVYGVVLPSNLMEKWEGVFVKVSENGSSIILTSGTKLNSLTKMELRNISKTIDEVYI